MLEDAAEDVKRYAPPPHGNTALNRRKSREWIGEKNKINSRAYPPTDSYANTENSNGRYNYSHSKLIPLAGCHSSDAAKFLNDRWAAVNSYKEKDSDLSHGRPITYSGTSDSSWATQLKFPHQMDFLAELRRTIKNFGT